MVTRTGASLVSSPRSCGTGGWTSFRPRAVASGRNSDVAEIVRRGQSAGRLVGVRFPGPSRSQPTMAAVALVDRLIHHAELISMLTHFHVDEVSFG